MVSLRTIVAFTLGFVLVAQEFAMASMLVLDPGTAGARDDATLGIGFEFQVASDTAVNSLGIWDNNDDGLTGEHYVVIWKASDQSNVAQVIVPSGTVAPLDAHFRWTDLASPVTLSTGTAYRIMSYYSNVSNSGDPFRDHSTTQVFSDLLAPGTLQAYFTNTPPSPYFPIWTGAWGTGRAYTGPNFSTTLMGVPEPGTLGLLAIAGLVMLAPTGLRRA